MKKIVPVTKAAEELLEKSGRPLHYKEITKMIFHMCILSGKTPHETVRSRIGTDPKFMRVAEGVYGLAKWKQYKSAQFAKDIAYEILRQVGAPMSIIDLGVKVLEERSFKGGPKMVIRNVIRNDKRFYLNKKTELVSLVEWKHS